MDSSDEEDVFMGSVTIEEFQKTLKVDRSR